MATLPYFVFSPNTVLSVLGLMRGPDKTQPTPAEDWRTASVDVVIPAHNEEEHIVLCLASVLRQTLRPRRILLVDDGSSDATAARARAFCEFHGVELVVIQRRQSIGKTPTIKRSARELDSDVLFVLDADTVLESDNYIRRTVVELYRAVGIASVCGTVLPLRQRDRRAEDEAPAVRTFAETFPSHHPATQKAWLRRLASGLTNTYREVLYLFLQRFIYRGQMALFGTTSNPVGCAVAYRRRYLEALFDYFEPLLGDDLTNSEDIFIGQAMLNEGYRNVQLTDVCARTVEPEVHRLPRQVYLWSSAFLQSTFYFDALLKSPFKALKRWRRRRGGDGQDGSQPRRGQRQTAPYVSIDSSRPWRRRGTRHRQARRERGRVLFSPWHPRFRLRSRRSGRLLLRPDLQVRRLTGGSAVAFRSRIGSRSGASTRGPTAVRLAGSSCRRRWKRSASRPSS